MQNIVEEHFPRRNKYRMERIINEIKSGSKTEKDYSVYPLEVSMLSNFTKSFFHAVFCV